MNKPATKADLDNFKQCLGAENVFNDIEMRAGCTWKTLYEALKPLGLRTPFWGALSGFSSTIGGGLSNNNAVFGSGTYGPATDSVTSPHPRSL